MKRRNNQKGFTLVELLVVIAIIGILAAVIAPNVFAQIERGKISAVVSEYRAVKTAAILVSSDNPDEDLDTTTAMAAINALLEKKMLDDGDSTNNPATAPFGGKYTIDSTGKFLIVPNVPEAAGNSIAKTIAGLEEPATTNTNDDVKWAKSDSDATADSASSKFLAIRLVQ